MYYQIMKMSFRSRLIYRSNTVIYIAGSFAYLFVTISIWSALYHGRGTVDSVSYPQMLAYLVVMQLIRPVTGVYISNYISERIVNGNISIDFIRPFKLKWAAVADELGGNLFTLIFFAIPITVVVTNIWQIHIPVDGDPWRFPFFFASVFLGAGVFVSIEYLVGLSVFWLKTGFHIQWVTGALFSLFSGGTVPLWFYPDWLRSIANALPFKHTLFTPADILLGQGSFPDTVTALLSQTVWFIALCIVCRLVSRRAWKNLSVQGG